MIIGIKDFLIEQLSRKELDELALGLLSYKLDKVMSAFSSRVLTISFLFIVDEMKINQQKEEKKKVRLEIKRQNVLKRWNKKKDIEDNTIVNTNDNNIQNDNDNIIDTKNTNYDTKFIQNDTNVISNELIDNKENIENTSNKCDTNNIQNTIQTNIQKDIQKKSLQHLLQEFIELRNKPVEEKESISKVEAEKPQIPDIIKDNNGNGKVIKSISSVLSELKNNIAKEDDTYFLDEDENDINTEEIPFSKKEKERSKEKEKKYMNNNIYNNKIYSLERGCGGKPFLKNAPVAESDFCINEKDDDDFNAEENTNLSDIDVAEHSELNKANNTEQEVLMPLLEQEQVSSSKPKQKRFKAPSVDEVQEYVTEKNYQINAEQFVDYYISVGWVVGKKPMKDWKAAVRTWVANEKKYSYSGTAHHNSVNTKNTFKGTFFDEEYERRYAEQF